MPPRKSLTELQEKWYKKLKNEGFDDIEQDEQNLKRWDGRYFRNEYNSTTFEAKKTYYQEAGKFLNYYKFQSILDKKIWTLHSDGLTVRAIVIELEQRGYKIYKFKVQETIKRLAQVMLDWKNPYESR